MYCHIRLRLKLKMNRFPSVVSVKYKIIDSNFLSFETKKNGKYEIIIKAPYSY